MALRAKPFSVPPNSQRSLMRPLSIGAMIAAFAFHSFACSGDVQDQRSSTSTGTSGTTASSSTGGETGGFGGSGGMGGNGASGGTGGSGGDVDGGSGPVEYIAYNLFTHVPRFVIFKIDHTRNLCFRISVELGGPGPLTIDVTAPWVTSGAVVTNDVNDCVMSMGFPPPPATFASATTGMGTLVVSGGFPCVVDLHAVIVFDPIGPWVPGNEPFDVDALNVDGGCQ